MSPLLSETLTWARSQLKRPDPDILPDDARRADAAMVRRVLSGEDGEAFLMLLARLTYLRPALDPGLTGAASHDYAQRRTGENAVFAAVIHYLDIAESLERTDHERPSDPRPVVFPWSGDFPAGGDAGDDEPGWSERDPSFDPAGTIAGR